MGARTHSKNIQYQACSIQYSATQTGLYVALLAGREIVIEYNQLCFLSANHLRYLIQFACAYKKLGMGSLSGTSYQTNRASARRSN
jgi:hypothetical protein